jgi:hypothetical protein
MGLYDTPRWQLTSRNPQTNATAKHTCPRCGKKGTFRRYWDNKTGDWLQGDYGRCDRVNGCGFDESPYSEQFYQRHTLAAGRALATSCGLTSTKRATARPATAAAEPETPPHDFAATFAGWWESYPDNTLRAWLAGLYGSAATSTCDDYLLTGTPNGTGWACYWQTDGHGIVTDGRMIKYQSDGHRAKGEGYTADWVRNWAGKHGESVPASTPKHLYGLHLLHDGDRVLIVEAEKTAIVLETCYRAGQRHRKYDCILATGGGTYLAGAFQRDAALLAAASSITLSMDNDPQGGQWVEVAARLQKLTHLRIDFDTETSGEGVPLKWDLADIVLAELETLRGRARAETAKIEANGSEVNQEAAAANCGLSAVKIRANSKPLATSIEAARQDSELADILLRFGFPADYVPRGHGYEAQFLF